MTDSADAAGCAYGCGQTSIVMLRPYGPGGAMVCAECALSTPEREQVAAQALAVIVSTAEAMSPTGVVVLTAGGGITPFVTEDDLEGAAALAGDTAIINALTAHVQANHPDGTP